MRRLATVLLAMLLGCGPGMDERIEHARALADDSRFEEMIPLLTTMHYEAPEDPEINHLYGLALLRTQNSGMAVWPLRRAASSPGREVEDGLLLAQALARGSFPFDAIGAIDPVLELEPERIEAWTLRATVNRSLKRYEDMLGDCDRIAEIRQEQADAILCRVEALVALERFEDAERALSEARDRLASGRGARDGIALRLCKASAELADTRDDSAEAAKRWEACLESSPTSLELIAPAAHFFDEAGDEERATRIFEMAVSEAPGRFDLVASLAERLESLGRDADAERILLDATRTSSRPAWLALAEHYRQRDEFEKAIEATETALSENPSLPTLLLAQHADDLIQAREFERADAVIQQLPDHPMVPLLRGRSYFVQGDAAAALEQFEEGLLLWPGNPTARYLAGQAAERLGDIDRAIAEYRDALRANAGHTDAPLDLARILEAEREYSAALVALRHRADAKPKDPEVYLAILRIARKSGRADAAAGALQALSELPDQQPVFVVESAAIRRLQEGPRAAADAILESELDLEDPANAEALAALSWHLAAAGSADEALSWVERVLRSHPEDAALHEIHGAALLAAARPPADARRAYERALELDTARASTLGKLAQLSAADGDSEVAVALYDRARSLDPDQSEYAWRAIQLLPASGGDAALDDRLLELLERNAIHPGAARMRAERLLARGEDLDEAESLALRAVRFGGGAPAMIVRARVAFARGDATTAREILQRVETRGPRRPSSWYALGLAYEEMGDVTRAKSALHQALEGGDFPDAADATQRLARLEGSVDD
jgi:tetratricopeptide (TPR) repeat protein